MKSALLFPIICGLIIGAVVIVLVAFGSDIFKAQGGGVFEQALTKLLDAKTFKVEGQTELGIEGTEGGLSTEGEAGIMGSISSLKVFLDVSGAVDMSKKDDFRTSFETTLGLDTEGTRVSGTVELTTVADAIFLRITSLPPSVASLLGGGENLKNQWIKIDFEALKQQLEQTGSQSPVELDEEELKERFSQFTEDMKELLKGKTLFDIKETLGEEEINGINTKHYTLEANKQAVEDFIQEYMELTKKYVAVEQKEAYEKQVQEAMAKFSDGFDQFWLGLGEITFDGWVEKRGGRLVKIKWEKDIEPSQIGTMPEGVQAVNFKSEFVFSDFNQRQNIEAPSVSKPFEEVLSSVMSQFMPQGLSTSSLPELP